MRNRNFIETEYLTIYASELRVIAGISALWGEREIESGGAMFGLWTHGARPVILLVTGPGRKATHEPAYFEQDVEFVHRMNEVAAGQYGIQLMGFHHCHHFLGLERPSSGDVSQVQSITGKNNLTRWCEIIATCKGGDEISRGHARKQSKLLHSGESLRIRVNAYLYTNPQRGDKIEVPVRILSGMSPYRLRALADGFMDPADIGQYASGFLKEQIIYDPFDFETKPSVDAEEVLEALAVQCQKLPRAAQNGISFHVEDDFITVTLPLPDNGAAHIRCGDKTPFQIQKVCVRDNAHGNIVDMTEEVLTDHPDTKLGEVYEILTRRQQKKAYQCVSWTKARAYLDVLSRFHSGKEEESLSKPIKGGPKNVGPKTR